MKISYNWLKSYVRLGISPAETADLLTMSGLEVDGIEEYQATLDGVVVGHVEKVERHPNADRLTVCSVDVGGESPLPIVCGAPNVAAGQRVPVALVGTMLHLPSRDNPEQRQPVTITRSKIRGEISEGMICAEDELGLSDDHSGIMVLSPDAEIGQPFEAYLRARGVEVGDAVLDVAVTPNRPDAVSHIGVARDLAALTRTDLSLPEVPLPVDGGDADHQVRIEIEAPEGCHRYVAMIVRGVRVGESPAWLRQRLTSVGLRPRNNIVDVTNFVMYECGQPLHAFDMDQLAGATIRVRRAEPGEEFVTLDSKRRVLPDDALLICDAERPVAIAGVMGGENSEVTDATVNVLIESAYFDPSSIRRTARSLGLQTDASYRFERGVDSDGQRWAAARAAALIAELSGGEVISGAVDARPIQAEVRELGLALASVERVLGVDIPAEEVARLLRAIGFGVSADSDGMMQCRVPTFRPDVTREIDVIEEIARLHGFDDIPEPETMRVPARAVPRERPIDLVRARIRGVLAGFGYREIYTNSLLSDAAAERFRVPEISTLEDGEVVRTLNPISQEMAALRPSLLPGMLDVLRHNANRGARQLRLFETGRVFRGGIADTVVPGFLESEVLLFAVTGLRNESAWYEKEQRVDFFDLKGAVATLLERLELPRVRMEPVYEGSDVTEYHLALYVESAPLGTVAKLSAKEAARYDLEGDVFFAELDVDAITALSRLDEPTEFRSLSRFPRVERDLAFLVDAAQEVGPVLRVIETSGGNLLRGVKPFDLYEGPGVPEGKKSVAFALVFGADRTLTDEEVDERVQRVVAAVREQFSADLRG